MRNSGEATQCLACSYDNAEVYAGGEAEKVMGQAIKVGFSVQQVLQLSGCRVMSMEGSCNLNTQLPVLVRP